MNVSYCVFTGQGGWICGQKLKQRKHVHSINMVRICSKRKKLCDECIYMIVSPGNELAWCDILWTDVPSPLSLFPFPFFPSLSFPPTPSSHENQVRHYHIKQDEVQKYYISEKHRFATIKDLIDYHKLNGGGTCAHHVTEKLGPGTRPFTGRRKGLGMHLHTSCSHAGMLTWPMKIVDCT